MMERGTQQGYTGYSNDGEGYSRDGEGYTGYSNDGEGYIGIQQ